MTTPANNMDSINVNQKLSTGIAGLDAIFHGGIHIHKYEEGHKGIVMLARGQHGVNKIHLSMQICEGLQESNMKKEDKWRDVLIQTIYAILLSKTREDVFFEKKILDVIDLHIASLVGDNNINKKKEWEGRKNEITNNYDSWFSRKGSSLLMNISKEIADEHFESCSDDIEVSSFLSSVNSKQTIYNWDKSWIKNKISFKLIENVYNDSDNQLSTLFISINKDSNLLKNSYYDFYTQRLIRELRKEVDFKSVNKRALLLLYSMPWSKVVADNQIKKHIKELLNQYQFPSIDGCTQGSNVGVEQFWEDIKKGFIYYNGRTHGLHVRHQKGSPVDTGELLLCKLDVPDDYKVRIIGKDTLNENKESADGLTTFQKMMKVLDNYVCPQTIDSEKVDKETDNNNEGNKKSPVEFIMIDGLSRLNEEELAQCPLNALSDKLRSKSIVGIITADEKLLPSEVSTDIVIDMDIRQNERPEHLNTALKISKCLYQKNAYGWHQYKMRNAGIEVIPSIHLQMGQRFIMDDVVADAILPANKYPYPYWLNENSSPFKDENICEANEVYGKHLAGEDPTENPIAQKGQLKGYLIKKDSLRAFVKEKISEATEFQHMLFVNLDKDRIEFIEDCIKAGGEDNADGKGHGDNSMDFVHLFNFRPSYIHADEILWALDQQVRAIETKARESDPNKDNVLKTHYTHVSLVFGDLNYIHYAYPCLSKESLFLPALAAYTKRHHMTNYIYAMLNDCHNASDTELFKKEMETIMQMRRIAHTFSEFAISYNNKFCGELADR